VSVSDSHILISFKKLQSTHTKISKTTSLEERELFLNESLFLSRVMHPHVVKFVDCGVDDNAKAFITTEKLTPHSPSNLESVNQPKMVADDLVSLLNILDFLAFLGLAHGDIKPEHLLRDENGNLVLIDYAQVFSLSKKVLIGTSAYLAPELFWNYGYSIQSDFFSLGLAFIEMRFQNDTGRQLIDKYGSNLKPWTSEDARSVKASFDGSSALVHSLKRMISYSPLDRPKSGREIAEVLIKAGETNWTVEQYDELIITALSHYIGRTHWIRQNNRLFRKTRDSTIRIKNCHSGCLSSFTHNFELINKFTRDKKTPAGQLELGLSGISVCRGKYFSGHIPRVMPKEACIPSSVGFNNNHTNNYGLDNLKLNYDFHFCYSNQNTVSESHVIEHSDVTMNIDLLNELALSRRYAEGLRLVELSLARANLSQDEILILIANQGYFLVCLGKAEKARKIFDSIEESHLQKANSHAIAEYHSCFGSYLFLTGNSRKALSHLEQALEIMNHASWVTDLSKAVVYNRLASVKWLTEGMDSAIRYNEKALEYALRIGKDEIAVPILLNRCMYFGESGNLVAEKESQMTLHEKMATVNSLPIIISYLHNIAAFCFRSGEIDSALSSIQRSYALALAHGESMTDVPHLLSLLGNICMRANDLTKASTAWKLAAHGLLKIGNVYLAGKCIQNLAEINFLSDNSTKALRFLKLAEQLFTRAGHKLGCCESELLKLMYAKPDAFKSSEIRKLLREYQDANHVWGSYHTLWLLAIYHLSNRNWENVSQVFKKMSQLSKRTVSRNVLEDMNFLKSVCDQFKKTPIQDDVDNSRGSFLHLLKRRGADSFRDNRAMISGLIHEGANILSDKRGLMLLIKEMQIEGRFMKTEDSKNNAETTQNQKEQNIQNSSVLMRFEVIRQIAGLVDQSKNVDEYVTKVLDLTVKALGASRGAIFISSKFSEEIEILGTSGCKDDEISDIKNISKSLLRHALGGNSIFIRNTASESKYDQLQSLVAKNIKSAICIPLKKDKEVFGAVYVDSLHFSTLFEDFDKSFLDTFGAIISGGINTSHRLQKLNLDYQNALKPDCEIGLRSSEGLFLPSPEMQEIYKLVFKISKTNFPVLLLGQTGSGKDVLARMIHENSEVNSSRYVAINCSAIPSEHLESELFGVAGKAFTDVAQRQGKFELAHDGTIFFDEIAEMPLNLQAKLLRVIETQEVEQVGGGGATKKVSFRLISATNKNIKQLVSDGRFREDLYHRINDLLIRIPDLSERPKDIELLAYHYFSFFQNKLNVKSVPFPDILMGAFLKYHWPGGIRELSKIVHNLVAFSDGSLNSVDAFPECVRDALLEISQNENVVNLPGRTMNKEQLLSTLRKSNFNIREAARLIQVPESTLRYQMKKLNIEPLPKKLRA